MAAHATIFINELGTGERQERPVCRLVGDLIRAWRDIPHIRRAVVVGDRPAIRFDRIEQFHFKWSSVNPRTERTIACRSIKTEALRSH